MFWIGDWVPLTNESAQFVATDESQFMKTGNSEALAMDRRMSISNFTQLLGSVKTSNLDRRQHIALKNSLKILWTDVKMCL